MSLVTAYTLTMMTTETGLHVGVLGELVPTATLIYLQGQTWKVTDSTGSRETTTGGYWYLATAAVTVNQSRHWSSKQVALDTLAAEGWIIAEESWRGITMQHAATDKAARAQREEREAKWSAAKACYVRYGRLPVGRRSRNHADGRLEAGVSVFRGQRLPNGEARPLPTTNQELGSLVTLSSRPLYIVTGREIGIGSDGEPLLVGCRARRAR